MQGFEALWLPGMDHAGIATQNLVERQLAAEGLSRHDLGREKFVERVWQWKAESGGAILGQMRRLGDSVDWDRERFTMDEGLTRAVQTIFKKLFDDGLIYRANRIINWCPRCLTALSDIEVEHTDDDGELISIRYSDEVVVATTRAETMLGDTAVAVHPDDERYQHLIGTEVELPLTGRRIPIVADAHVDPAFGTGMVKVTPAHDPNDFEIGQRHDLPALTVMDERGVITVPGPFEGLDRFEARPAIVAALREQGRIVAEKRPYVHAVGHCSRCKTTVEPRLSLQWFVNTAPLAKAAGDAVRDGRVAHRAGRAGQALLRLGRQHARLVHLPPALVGAPHPGLVRPGRARSSASARTSSRRPATAGGRTRTSWTPGSPAALWPFSTLGWPEQTPDLAQVLPDQRPGHRLRHPVLLGRPDDDVRPVRDGRRAAVRRGGPARHGPRRARQEDVEVVRQRRRPAGLDRPVRRRRHPVHAGPGRQPRRRTSRSARSGARAPATSATSSGTPPASP